ncbi:MAG TPA: hypothetical protein VJT70_06970 [Sphingomicrobium sp.]|nr:hypothetical protein [Sphingomicrobium sp.]
MMKRLFIASAVLLAAAPADATGGLVCRTANSRPLEVSVGFGHVPGSPLILTRLLDNGRQIPVRQAQWWLDNAEVRLLLIAPDARQEELKLRARRNGLVYDGSVWRGGKRRWIRCREG